MNLGCPSRTVVTKYRGSGFLAKPGELDAFFAEVFSACGGEGSLGEMQISVKTRLGVEEPEEFFRILDIYNRYPLKELIIHPRTQRDFYSGPVHMDLFAYGAEHSRCPVCYNGDIRTGEDMRALEDRQGTPCGPGPPPADAGRQDAGQGGSENLSRPDL